MHRCADTAEALGVHPGFAGIATHQYLLDTAPHLARRPGFRYLAVVNLDVDSQVAFDAGNRVNSNTGSHNKFSSNRLFDYARFSPCRTGKRLTTYRKTITSNATRPSVTMISGTEGSSCNRDPDCR